MTIARHLPLMFAIVLALTGNAIAEDTSLRIPAYVSKTSASELSTTPPLTFTVALPRDARPGGAAAAHVGERKTIGDISMGEVGTVPEPAELIRDVLTAELKSAGHQIVDQNPNVLVSGELRRFALWTDVTMLYWDVRTSVDVAVEVTDSSNGKISSQYSANCSQRTYLWPGPEIMTEVIADCLKQIGTQFRTDASLRQFLGAAPRK